LALLNASKPILSHYLLPGRTALASRLLTGVLEAQRNARLSKIPRLPSVIGQKPVPLPTRTGFPMVSAETARLQRSYRKLVELGLHDEAAEIAERLRLPNAEVVPAVAVVTSRTDEKTGNAQTHEAFFRGKPFLRLEADQPVPWSRARTRRISCRFQGESLAQVLKYVHEQTSLSIQAGGDEVNQTKVYFQCVDQPLETVLATALPSCGWEYTVRSGGLVVTRPLLTSIRESGLPIVR
jgi:hypothetical protein